MASNNHASVPRAYGCDELATWLEDIRQRRIRDETEKVLATLSTDKTARLVLNDSQKHVDNSDIIDDVVKLVRDRHGEKLTVFNFYTPERVNGKLVRVASFNRP